MRTVGLKIGDISAESVDGFNNSIVKKLGLGSDKTSSSSIRVSILVYLETIQLNRLYQTIWEKNAYLLFVLNITSLLEVRYSISINWLLILILIQRLLIHGIAKNQNSIMNHIIKVEI